MERSGSSPDPTAPGLGRSASGPGFAPPASGHPMRDEPLLPGSVAARPHPQPHDPRAGRPQPYRQSPPVRIAPAVGTAVILALAAVVLVAGGIAGVDRDRKAAEEAARPTPTPTYVSPPALADDPTQESDAIEFTTAAGRGTLTVVDHTWLRRPGSQAVRLRVQVEIRALDGMIEYDPAYFFAARNLSDPVRAEDSFTHGDLDVGVLQSGEAARGYLSFRIPRGDVTLMMSDDASDWVTAIKIAD